MADVESSSEKVQAEPYAFRRPASEEAMFEPASLLNYVREMMMPVGSVVASVLDEATFQAENNSILTRWCLANGQSVLGSKYQTLTGEPNAPDLRGIMIRGANNGRSTTNGNGDGDISVLTYSVDRLKPHTHTITDPGHNHTPTDPGHAHPLSAAIGLTDLIYDSDNILRAYSNANIALTLTINSKKTGISLQNNQAGIVVDVSGDGDGAPRNITLNWFVRIN